MGFTNPEKQLLEKFNLELDARGNIKANDLDYKTSVEGVFCCGDSRRGASLIVWGIYEGRKVAESIDKYFIEK
jgi:glutamate synthase (NADPH) small chain